MIITKLTCQKIIKMKKYILTFTLFIISVNILAFLNRVPFSYSIYHFVIVSLIVFFIPFYFKKKLKGENLFDKNIKGIVVYLLNSLATSIFFYFFYVNMSLINKSSMSPIGDSIYKYVYRDELYYMTSNEIITLYNWEYATFIVIPLTMICNIIYKKNLKP